MKTFPYDHRYQRLIELLREERKKQGLTQTHVADFLKKPQSYVSKYEGAERRLDPIELFDICNALGVGFGGFCSRLEQEIL